MEHLFSLAGKQAIVTGGAQGLGRMIAQGLVDAGADVWITSRKAEICSETAAELGQRCHALAGDAGSAEGIADIAQRWRDAGNDRLHLIVNNAGRTWGASIETFPAKAWAGVMAVNVQAPFMMVQEFLPELEAAGTADDPARVINIGSIAGAQTNDLGAYSYVASKAAIHQLSRQLAHDLAPRNINVNAILPGYFPTSMTEHLRDTPEKTLENTIPMRRLGRPDDIAGSVVYLASRASAYVTGVELAVDGGLLGA